ncbi:MAG: Trk system potassium transporter TrkA [Desulfofustis sp.]|jgi:trk system potassium uptake protein TrkA|nr:Trk system potassium transporter TrkA [Desulfofustis sp.]
MKILIYGVTDAGYMAARFLSDKHDVSVLAENKQLPERFANLDVNFISGSGTDLTALEQANAAAMDLFVACSAVDEANIVACWTIKRIVDIETTCFVRTMELYQNLHLAGPQSRYRTAYDIDTVIWPEQLLTQDIFRIVSVPDAVDVKYFDRGNVKLFEYRIKEGSEILNRRIMDCTFPKQTLIVGITRENDLFIPQGSTVIELNDKVVFMGTGSALDLLTARFFKAEDAIKEVVVIGGGSVGFLLAQQLEAANLHVTIIEHDYERCTFLADKLKKSLVLHGDGTDLDLLENAGIAHADTTICVTDNDEKNLLCSLMTKQLSPCRIIARVGNANTAPLFDRVGIDVVVSPLRAALKDLLNRIQSREIDILALIEGGQGEVVKLTVPEDFQEQRVADLRFGARAIIGVVQRGWQIIVPHGETVIKAGDQLKIFTMASDVEAIGKMFGG